jgi:23S rRNA (cytidine2498-2'-O)-methyltransferase
VKTKNSQCQGQPPIFQKIISKSIVTEFVFATCLPRSMPYLKRELARTRPDLRLAYSRPGLITMRTDAVPSGLNTPEPQAVFARATGRSLGFADSLDRIVELAGLIAAPEIRVHVFARDPVKPDDQLPDYEGIRKWRESIRGQFGTRVLEGDDAKPGDTVLDVVLPPPGVTDPILVGWHMHDPWRGAEPGGVCQVPVPPDVPSRAYAKIEEALNWSALPLHEGDVVVEIGSAPGGAAMALLQRGANVIGIDPSRMDPRVLDWHGARGTFRHVSNYAERLRTRDLPAQVDWLVLDANIAPHRALVALKHLMSLRGNSVRGLLLTLKLHDEGVIEDLPMLFTKIREIAGAVSLRATQLPSAHQEVVVWVQRLI